MRLTATTRSLEPCAEAGWYAYNLHFEDGLIDEPFVRALRPLGGSMLFMRHLAKPFFKLENHTYIVRGVVGDNFIRVGVHADHEEEELHRIQDFVHSILEQGSATDTPQISQGQ